MDAPKLEMPAPAPGPAPSAQPGASTQSAETVAPGVFGVPPGMAGMADDLSDSDDVDFDDDDDDDDEEDEHEAVPVPDTSGHRKRMPSAKVRGLGGAWQPRAWLRPATV